MKKIFWLLNIVVLSTLTACGGGGSDSGGTTAATAPTPDGSVPAALVGVYQGTLNLTASALGISQSDSAPITITVTADGQVQFEGDEPDETFTVPISSDGSFSSQLEIQEDECSGTVSVQGQVNTAGTNASGTLAGDGSCTFDGDTLDVELSGDFSADR